MIRFARLLAICAFAAALPAQTLQTPEDFFGFKIGADRKLARYDKIVDYFKLIAAQSDRRSHGHLRMASAL